MERMPTGLPAPASLSGEHMSRAYVVKRWRWDVFVCHAGPDKTFARLLYDEMQPLGLRCFVDEDALSPGGKAYEEMEAAARSTHIAVVLLCEEFFQREAPRRELGWFLSGCKQDRNKVVPVFFQDHCRAVRGAGQTIWAGGGHGHVWLAAFLRAREVHWQACA